MNQGEWITVYLKKGTKKGDTITIGIWTFEFDTWFRWKARRQFREWLKKNGVDFLYKGGGRFDIAGDSASQDLTSPYNFITFLQK